MKCKAAWTKCVDLPEAPDDRCIEMRIAHWSGDTAWARVRPPLVELDRDQAETLIDELERAGFRMPGMRNRESCQPRRNGPTRVQDSAAREPAAAKVVASRRPNLAIMSAALFSMMRYPLTYRSRWPAVVRPRRAAPAIQPGAPAPLPSLRRVRRRQCAGSHALAQNLDRCRAQDDRCGHLHRRGKLDEALTLAAFHEAASMTTAKPACSTLAASAARRSYVLTVASWL